jgi:hypothetical protein
VTKTLDYYLKCYYDSLRNPNTVYGKYDQLSDLKSCGSVLFLEVMANLGPTTSLPSSSGQS